jgi:hypothetical protein
MTTSVQEGPAIVIGYAYRLRLEAASALFPDGVLLTAQIRTSVDADSVLAVLSTQAGGLVRVSDTGLDLEIPASVTATLTVGSVVLDAVRTDTDPELHLGFTLEIPVVMPVTRGLGHDG